MRLRILEPLERKARAAIKDTPKQRAINRKQSAMEKHFAAGKISKRMFDDLKALLSLAPRPGSSIGRCMR